MTAEPWSDLAPGMELYTSDGEKIGAVKEIRDGALKVDAPMELDYWLPLASVVSVGTGSTSAATEEGRVRLEFRWQELGTYKMAGPGDIAGTAAAEEANPAAPALDSTSDRRDVSD